MNTVFRNWSRALMNKRRVLVVAEMLCLLAVASVFLIASPLALAKKNGNSGGGNCNCNAQAACAQAACAQAASAQAAATKPKQKPAVPQANATLLSIPTPLH